MTSTAAEKTSKLLAALWQRNLPVVRERLDLLDRAAALAAVAHLSPELRTEAAAAAHKLAGSLGMYGYPEATSVARELEQALEGDSPLVDSAHLSPLTLSLRRSLAL